MDMFADCSTVVDSLRLAARQHPDRTAFVYLADGEQEEGTLTYRQLDQQARAVATALLERGAERQRALLLHPVGLDFVTALMGCFYAGVTAVPVPPEDATIRGHDRLEAIIADCTPALALSSSSQPPADGVDVPVVATDALASGPSAEAFPAITGDTVAVLQYTSGSTALPRGAMVTHRNVLANCQAMHEAWNEPDGATTVCWLPLHHDMGLFGLVLRSVTLAGRCVLMPPLAFIRRPLRWLRAVSRYGAFVSGGPNFGYELCLRRANHADISDLDLSAWKIAFNGAEPVRPATLRSFTHAFAPTGFAEESFAPSYGLAEITLGVSTAADRHPARTHTVSRSGLQRDEITAPEKEADRNELVCCGLPLPGNDIVIAEPDTRAPASEGRVGEIWVSGPSVAAGYWNKPEDTADTFHAHLSDGRGPYLRTGDLGYLHDGQVVITGRIKDLMIVRGANHYPQDIEETVQASHPALRPGCGAAFTQDLNDEERLTIVQEIKPDSDQDMHKVCQDIRHRIASRHGLTPATIALVRPGQVPKTSSGKIQRRLTRTLLEDDRLRVLHHDTEQPATPADTAPLAQITASRLAEQAAIVLDRSPDDIAAAPSLTAAGLDSLRAAELQEILHQEFSVTVEMADLLADQNVADLASRMTAIQPAATDAPAPALTPATGEDGEPFPLTPVQQAYLAGRSPDFPLGGVGTHAYQEFHHPDLDIARAVEAWHAVVERHPMLRAVLSPDGAQRITPPHTSTPVEVDDLRGSDKADAEEVLLATRERMSHQVHDPFTGPLFEIRLTLLPGGEARVHLSFDLLILDGRSLIQVLGEWGEHYRRPHEPAPIQGPTFRDYLCHQQQARRGRNAETQATPESPELPSGPGLPLATDPDTAAPRFQRRSSVVEPEIWQALQACARTHGVTSSALLCAAYSQVLALFSEERPFTLTVTSFQPPPRTMSPEVVGEFTRLLLLPVDVGTGTFDEHARKVSQGLAAAMEPGRPDGVTQLREQARTHGHAGPPRPLAPVVFTSLLEDTAGLDWLGEEVFAVSQTPQVWLDHQATEHHGALRLVWDAVEGLFPDGLLEEMFSCYQRLLHRLAQLGGEGWRRPGRDLAGLPSLASCRVSEAMPGSEVLLNQLVEAQVEAAPNAHAVLTAQRPITYRQLGNAARLLVHALREADSHSGDVVAVVLPRGWEQSATVNGVLAAGGVYVPLDPEAPARRLHELLEDSTARFAITTRALDRSLSWPPQVRRIVTEDLWAPGLDQTPPPPPAADRAPGDLAYITYTSGSSGRPKGVAIEHRGAANTILDINDRFSLTPQDRVLGVTPLTFDLAVYDVFGTLAAGAGLVVPAHDRRGDPAHWHELIDRHRVSVWNSVPALLRLLAEDPAAADSSWRKQLRLLMLSGDWIPVDFAARLRRDLPDAQLVSLGGATEGSIWSVLYDVDHVEPEWASIPYGQGMRGQGAHVLDAQLEPRPVLTPGPLYLSGAGLAREYWADPDRTARSFPTHEATGRRLYRTGDVARLLPDGNLEILGREDQQIKAQGRRIEPGEIEAALTAHPAVTDAVVGAQGPRDGIRRLIAYARPHADQAIGEQELHEHLTQRLPRYLIPDAVHLIEQIPLTRNGKVDRRALFETQGPPAANTPATAGPGAKRAGDNGLASAAAATELLDLVAQCAEITSADPARSFSELGMTSMHLIRLTNLLQERFGHRPSVDELYQMQSVKELLDYYGNSADGTHPTSGGRAAGRKTTEVLADPQQRDTFKQQARSRSLHREGALTLNLPAAENPQRDADLLQRSSQRTFASSPLPVAALAEWLSCLREHQQHGQRKSAWASAGGLYPIRICLQIQPGAVTGIAAGLYAYQPGQHALELLSEQLSVREEDHWPENRPLQRQAGVAVFLIADLEAIEPLYGELAERYCLLEAGAIAQTLAVRAPAAGIGACPVGALSFAEAARQIGLGEGQPLLHTLLAGPSTEKHGEHEGPDSRVEQSETPAGQDPAVVPLQGAPRAVPTDQLTGHTHLELATPPTTAAVQLPPRAVLVTGATGFLGAFLVARLLRSTDAVVYCLVRAANAEQARTRVMDGLAAHGIRIDVAMSERIIGVVGDLSAPRLGLQPCGYDQLNESVDVVMHSGAQVNWLQPYQALEEANVTGTRRVLDFTADGNAKRLLHLSTVAVFPFGGDTTLTEGAPLHHDGLLYGGYPQSKWVAEQLVHTAAQQGLDAIVARPGTVSGCSHCGAFNPSSFLDVLFCACLQSGWAPTMDAVLDMAPVDYVARAAVELAVNPERGPGPYHLTNPHPAPLEEVWDHIAALGYKFHREPYEAWRQRMLRPGVINATALAPFATYLAGAEEQFLRLPPYDCTHTLRDTEAAGDCQPVGPELLATYFDAYRRSGFLPAPPGPRTPVAASQGARA